MSSFTRTGSDKDLTAIVEAVFRSAGFALARSTAEFGEILLAENAYFIVACAATPTLNGLYAAEPVLEAFLSDRMKGDSIGPKVWDAYLVLLTQERPAAQGDGLRSLFGINYDTRGLRRIAKAGITATTDAVRSALAPFVEPIHLDLAETVVDPFEAMKIALTTHGVDKDFAAQVVDVFQQGGRLNDTL